MLSIQKIGCIPICLSFAFHACIPATVYECGLKTTAGPAVDKPVIYRNDIPIKAVRELLSRFADAKDVDWQKTVGMGWTARFGIGPVKTRMEFDVKGTLNAIWSEYAETPADIKLMIAKNFGDYHINSVRGLSTFTEGYNVVFSVTISKEDDCKIIKVSKGNLSIFSQFKTIPAGPQ